MIHFILEKETKTMTNCLKKIHLYMYHESVKMLAGNINIHWPFIIHQFEIRTSTRFNAINYKSNNNIAAPFGFTLLLAAILTSKLCVRNSIQHH